VTEPIPDRVIATAQEAWSIEEAIAEIHRLSGRQFDPVVVAAFD
jgi:HD-GYP domain-containing protein (c-di-GMP phosphodiesterase class II)